MFAVHQHLLRTCIRSFRVSRLVACSVIEIAAPFFFPLLSLQFRRQGYDLANVAGTPVVHAQPEAPVELKLWWHRARSSESGLNTWRIMGLSKYGLGFLLRVLYGSIIGFP